MTSLRLPILRDESNFAQDQRVPELTRYSAGLVLPPCGMTSSGIAAESAGSAGRLGVGSDNTQLKCLPYGLLSTSVNLDDASVNPSRGLISKGSSCLHALNSSCILLQKASPLELQYTSCFPMSNT